MGLLVDFPIRPAGRRPSPHPGGMMGEPEFHIDEVGIAYGRLGEVVLKSCYQPLFCIAGDWLQPFGVEALVTGFCEEETVPPDRLFGLVDGEDRTRLERLCRVLHVCNYENMGLPGMQLYFNADPGFTREDVEHLIWILAENGLPAECVTCEIVERPGDAERLPQLAAELRQAGLRLAVDDFGAGHSTAERVRMLRPETVKIDGAWFDRVTAHPDALDLLPGLFARLREQGARILVEGIETPWHLRSAIWAGADLFQGYLLARPALAGTIVDETPVAVEALLDPADRPPLRAGG